MITSWAPGSLSASSPQCRRKFSSHSCGVERPVWPGMSDILGWNSLTLSGGAAPSTKGRGFRPAAPTRPASGRNTGPMWVNTSWELIYPYSTCISPDPRAGHGSWNHEPVMIRAGLSYEPRYLSSSLFFICISNYLKWIIFYIFLKLKPTELTIDYKIFACLSLFLNSFELFFK